MGFPCDIFINKDAQKLTVSYYRVTPSMNSSGNFVGMKRWMKNCPFGFININRELIYF